MNFRKATLISLLFFITVAPLMINSLRSTYFDYTSGIDQSFKLNQKSELPPFYGNCIYEIRSINNWSGNLESDKYFRFKSVNSSDYKCLGRIIGSSEIQVKLY